MYFWLLGFCCLALSSNRNLMVAINTNKNNKMNKDILTILFGIIPLLMYIVILTIISFYTYV